MVNREIQLTLENQVQDLTMWTNACLQIEWSMFKPSREHCVVFLGKTLSSLYPGGVLKKVLYGEALPRGPTPYPFIYHFFRKGTPFVYLLFQKGTPFMYLLKKTYE